VIENSLFLDNPIENVLLASRLPQVLEVRIVVEVLGYNSTSLDHILVDSVTELVVRVRGDLQLLGLVFLGHVLDLDGTGDEILPESMEDGYPLEPTHLDHVVGLGALRSTFTNVDLGTGDFGAVLVAMTHEYDQTVSADGIEDHVNPALVALDNLWGLKMGGRLLDSPLDNLRSRLLSGLADDMGSRLLGRRGERIPSKLTDSLIERVKHRLTSSLLGDRLASGLL
jgi:hypothetical protein